MIIKTDANFSRLNQYIEETKPSKIFFLCDENTHRHCLPVILANLETAIPFEIVEISHGEEMKNIETAAHLWSILAEFQADRNSLIINVGGGVITDMGGFVASTYKRGIRFIHIPTTLLAMCDASIGGKTGIDHSFLKNIVGTFSLPDHIFLYPDFLKTLPFVELRSGFAEMLKHGLIADGSHWKDLSQIAELTVEVVSPFVERSMQIKQNIVDQDFKEKNIRKTLNFGHTVGHAAESLFLESGEPIPHGEAVAMGMIIETQIARYENLIDENTCGQILYALTKFFPILDIGKFSKERLESLMRNDKKNSGDWVNFSLITKTGACNYDYRPSPKNVDDAIRYYRNLHNSN